MLVGMVGTVEKPDRVASRASNLLPEEKLVDSEDPEAQAEAILDESDERATTRGAPPDVVVEQRTSEETVEPVD